MKNVSPLPEFEEIESMIEKYKLPDSLPKFHSFEDISEFVIESCKHLFPEELYDFFWRSNQYDTFVNDIKLHFIISWLLTDSSYNNPQFLDSNHNLCKKMITILGPIEENQGFYGKRDPSNYMKELKKHVSPFLNLSMSKRKSKSYYIKEGAKKLTKQVDIPKYAAPYVIFLANYYDLIKITQGIRELSNEGNKKINIGNVKEYLEISWNNFTNVLDNLEEYNDFRACNLHLFEREFNFILISKIIKITQRLQEFAKNEAIKVLSCS
ncbi:hypothetical protein EXW96_26620 [Paenibacillus sp. JMULE4]|uniref:hypothetical protein n=1 Tax=Paenibacillus sp. JMULE4 TaxID=2518342 RepID=UPI001576BD97|nr:hypothetical protein [Paenibacillus sp. JMULE4]NTZ20965.1 hypothetical protein [Paenibacillus sp. JMULE4]